MYYSGAYKPKQKWVVSSINEWILSRISWPRALFVSSVYYSYWPVREALFLGIPCFGVVDTNTICDYITIPFPGNDESIKCMAFYNDCVSNFILIKKFKRILKWYIYIRQPKKISSFKKWLFNKWINFKYTNKFYLNKIKLNNIFNLYIPALRLFFGSADLFFSRSYGLDYKHSSYNFKNFSINFGKYFSLLLKKKIYFLFKLNTIIVLEIFDQVR